MENSIKSTLAMVSQVPSFNEVVGTMLFGENQPNDMLAMRASSQSDPDVRKKLITLYQVQPQLFNRNLRNHFTTDAEPMIEELKQLSEIH